MIRALLIGFIPILLSAAPYGSGPTFSETVDNLQNELDNHDKEMQIFRERLENQELIMESLRDTVEKATGKNQKIVLGNKNTVDHIEDIVNRAVKDIKTLQSHLNDSVKALKSTKEKVDAMDQKLAFLQETVDSLITILNPDSTYKVRQGDSLEKIARKHQTTVKKLKETNRLSTDKIIVGQTLKIP